MIERYHLGLAAVAVVAGMAVALADTASSVAARRAIAVAAAVGALIGSWGSPRAWPWLVAALLPVLVADRPDRAHPLGVWAAPMAVMSLVGVWSAVPDTEPPLAAAAVLLPIAVSRAAGGRPIGPASSVALLVAVCGAAWVGSAGWGAALATACAVGLIAVAPLVWGFGTVASGRVLAGLLTAQAVVALVVPRTVMSRSVPVAVVIAMAVLLLSTAVCAQLRPSSSALPS